MKTPTPPMIYLDTNATTPLLPEVREAMEPYLSEHFGNPSSQHRAGRRTRQALEDAREKLATCVGAQVSEIIFTSSATEANNLALFGSFPIENKTAWQRGLAVDRGEHPCVTQVAETLQHRGLPVHWIELQQNGHLDDNSLDAAFQLNPAVLSVMYANHETGVIHSIASLGKRCREKNIILHCDAVQAAGRLPVDVAQLQVDMLSLSGHKVYGPKGIGLLYVRTGTKLQAHVLGGPQERELRAGTENVAAAVGFAKAMQISESQREQETLQLTTLRDTIWNTLRSAIPDIRRHGDPEATLCNTLSISLPGHRNEVLLMQLDLKGIAISTGSACASGATEPSPVLQAMGCSEALTSSALRLSLGKGLTKSDVDRAAQTIIDIVKAQQNHKSNTPT